MSRLLKDISSTTYLEVEVCIEHFTAHVTPKALNTSMYFDMLVEVGSLGEAKSTVLEGAHVGALIGVYAQVVEEIVPFTEPFVAAIVITFEHLDVSLASRVLVGENSEFLGVRHMLLDLHTPQVEGASCFHCDQDFPADFLKCLAYASQGFGSHLMFSRKFHGRRVRSEVGLLRGLKLVSFNRSHILGFSLGH
jgi:hypothetical protein